MKILTYWWLYILIATLPFERIPSLDFPVGERSVTIRLSMIVAVIALIFIGSKINWREIKISASNPILWLVLYSIVMVASTAQSLNLMRSVFVLIATLITIGVAVLISQTLKNFSLYRIYAVYTVTALAVAAFGLYQFFGDSIGLSTAFTGLRENYVKEVFGFPRVQSTALEPLFFGNYLLMPILLIAALIYTRQKLSWKSYAVLVFLVTILGLTLSRGAIIGAGTGAVLVLIGLYKYADLSSFIRLTSAAVLGIATCLLLIFVVTNATSGDPGKGKSAVNRYVKQSQAQSTATSGDSDRIVNRKLAQQAFKERPLLGYGPGAFGAYAQQAYPAMYPDSANYPTVNNEYYEILAETGLAGATALVGFGITLIYQSIRKLRTKLPTYHRTWIAALLITCIAYGIQYYAFSTLYIMHIWVTVGILLGLTAASYKFDEKVTKTS